ncbi:hypothetical protein Ciccas_004083 [Cichlidogyrus casuarinus]|uniref:Uncharacterized protein n=1 Tax=Cichlidogyrus casuarinus TaxID=1844966 RepID=A0ABD2QCJ8_9PLAT
MHLARDDDLGIQMNEKRRGLYEFIKKERAPIEAYIGSVTKNWLVRRRLRGGIQKRNKYFWERKRTEDQGDVIQEKQEESIKRMPPAIVAQNLASANLQNTVRIMKKVFESGTDSDSTSSINPCQCNTYLDCGPPLQINIIKRKYKK